MRLYSIAPSLHLLKDHRPYSCIKDRGKKSAALYRYLATSPFSFDIKIYKITLHFIKLRCTSINIQNNITYENITHIYVCIFYIYI